MLGLRWYNPKRYIKIAQILPNTGGGKLAYGIHLLNISMGIHSGQEIKLGCDSFLLRV